LPQMRIPLYDAKRDVPLKADSPAICLAKRKRERTDFMNKKELVSSVAKQAGLTNADATKAVEAFINSVTGALKEGGDVRLPGFGSFEISHRAASKGVNPSNGAPIDIPARNVPKFKAGNILKEAVNDK